MVRTFPTLADAPLRYRRCGPVEIENITPPKDIIAAMEKQMRAEREKRGTVLQAGGQASAILAVAEAAAKGLRKVAEAIQAPGGHQAMQLRVAEQFVTQFGQIAQQSTTLVLPANVADLGAMVALATNIIRHGAAPADAPR